MSSWKSPSARKGFYHYNTNMANSGKGDEGREVGDGGEGDAKLSAALANLSLTFSQLLQGSIGQDIEQVITSRNDKTSDEIIQDLKKLLVSCREDCKLAAEIGQAVLGKYQELHEQNKELRESVSMETLKRTEMVKKEQDENTQLRRELQSMERKLLHSSSKNESLELQLRQLESDLDHHHHHLKGEEKRKGHHSTSITEASDDDEEKSYLKSQSEVLQMKLELLQQKQYNTSDRLEKYMLENQSLKLLESEVQGLRQEAKRLESLRTENVNLKVSLKQALDQICQLNEQLRGSCHSLSQLAHLKSQYENVVREKDEISSLLEDARTQLELVNDHTVSSSASSMALASSLTLSTLNQSSTVDSLDRELKKIDFTINNNNMNKNIDDNMNNNINNNMNNNNIIYADQSPTKKAELDRCEKRLKAKEFLLTFRSFGRRAMTLPPTSSSPSLSSSLDQYKKKKKQPPMSIKGKEDEKENYPSNFCNQSDLHLLNHKYVPCPKNPKTNPYVPYYNEEKDLFLSEIENLRKRIKMTNLLDINRKRGLPFDTDQLVAISNETLTVIQQDIINLEYKLQGDYLSSLKNQIYNSLREICDLRITLNEYGKAYVSQVNKKK